MAISNPLLGSIPIANPYTKEILQERLPIATDTPYSTQYTKQPYTELSLYTLSPTDEGTFTQIVTEDFALTTLSVHVEGGSAATKRHTLYLNDVPIAMVEAVPSVAIDSLINFPSVIVRKGSIIRLEATESGGVQSLRCLYVFIGFRF